MKRLRIVTCVFIVIVIISSITYASSRGNILNVTQDISETKYLQDNQGYISKQIVETNSEEGEVTIELKLSNTKKETEKEELYENTEVYIIVSENIVKDNEKLTKYMNDIENLSNNIFRANTKTKIGIIGITGTIRDRSIDENGNMVTGEKDEGMVDGTAENSEIVVELTNNLDIIKNSLQHMNSSKNIYHNNLQAAIRLANRSYSNNVNKILISLYDGVPDIAIGVHSEVTYGWFSEYSTAEEGIKAKHENIANYTRSEIMTLKDSDISFILLRPDDTSYDETWYHTSTGEKLLDFDGSPYVQKLYGTMDNPTYGKMYSFNDTNIDTIITENIYKDVKELIQPDISNVKVTDYFPKDIIEYFDFEYVGQPSRGTISNSIDKEDRTIIWDIGLLKGNEEATLKYKLKIKDIDNKELLDKEIDTNEKVVLTYKDQEEKENELILDSSPKIKLQKRMDNQLQENLQIENTNKIDNTIANKILPNTGIKEIIIVLITCIGLIGIITYIKYRKIKLK
ncbi:MAG: hypothetical protein HFJ40_03660 [Clostridia bacterium]|nr:hypothetical protein [Clostridia bacterium]